MSQSKNDETLAYAVDSSTDGKGVFSGQIKSRIWREFWDPKEAIDELLSPINP